MQRSGIVASRGFKVVVIAIGLGNIALGLDYAGWTIVALGVAMIFSVIADHMILERKKRRSKAVFVPPPSGKRP